MIKVSKCELIDAILSEPKLAKHTWLARRSGEFPYAEIDVSTLGEANAGGFAACAVSTFYRNRADPRMSPVQFSAFCRMAEARATESSMDLFKRLVRWFDNSGLDYKSDAGRFALARYIDFHFPDEFFVSDPPTAV